MINIRGHFSLSAQASGQVNKRTVQNTYNPIPVVAYSGCTANIPVFCHQTEQYNSVSKNYIISTKLTLSDQQLDCEKT